MTKDEASSIALFPIAIPLLTGPGAIATVLILNNPNYGAAKGISDFSTAIAILIDCFIVWLLFVTSTKLTRILKPSVMMIVGKTMDILMRAIGISFIMGGLNSVLAH